jgi:hypothetical protein
MTSATRTCIRCSTTFAKGREALLFLLNVPSSERNRFRDDYDTTLDYVGRQFAADVYVAQDNLELPQHRITGEVTHDQA